jgi:hypothetical protein
MQEHQNGHASATTRSPDDLLSPADIEREYGIKESTQAVWRSANRWGWRDDAIKVGRLTRKRRKTIEAWLEKRTGLPTSRTRASEGAR